MRGDFQHTKQGLAQAVAVLDLAMAGVQAEMGEVPFGWFDAPVAAAPAKPAVGVAVAVAPSSAPARELGPLVMPAKREVEVATPVKAAPAAVEIPGEVWAEGEAGGVLLVTQMPPDARCKALASAMLLAAGVKDMATAWVGYSGKVSAIELLAAMRGQAPKQVLVLGQAPLGVLMGKNLGVEGWHAATSKAIAGWDGAPVGVTYPLELLVKQSLFKRLAWQHLLAWGEDTDGTTSLSINVTEQGE